MTYFDHQGVWSKSFEQACKVLSILPGIPKGPWKLQQQSAEPVSFMEWIDPIAEVHFILLGVFPPLMGKRAIQFRSELKAWVVGYSASPALRTSGRRRSIEAAVDFNGVEVPSQISQRV